MSPKKKIVAAAGVAAVLVIAAGWPLYGVLRSSQAAVYGDAVASRALTDIALKLLQQGLQRYGAQVSGTLEKQTGAFKETQQAELNYSGTIGAVRAANAVEDRFAGQEVVEQNMCQVAGDQLDTGTAKVSSDLWAKADGASSLARSAAGQPAAVSINAVVDGHLSEYCSDEDLALGRACKTSGNGMQNADLTVSTALTPNLAMTLSDEEYKASKLAARNIVNAVPTENIAPGVEKNGLGHDYLVAKRSEDATLSLADHAFAKIIARRRSQE